MVEPIERFQGMLIFGAADGFYWSDEESHSAFATIELCRADIKNYLDNQELAEDEPGELKVILRNSLGDLDSVVVGSGAAAVEAAINLIRRLPELRDGDSIVVFAVGD